MRIEIHVLQNVAPANLNRDDTNSPKDAIFGGYRRARLSSQSQKRAVRLRFEEHLTEDDRALRTKRLLERITEILVQKGKDPVTAGAVARTALEGLGLAFDEKGLSQYLLFLGNREIEHLAGVILEHWETLEGLAGEEVEGSGKERKKKAKAKVPDAVKKALEAVLDGGRAVDLALFGRMLADRPEWNVDAAAQVAHAISTHKVDREFDFYTAVDDLNPKEETGAGMMGDVEFYSATLYRYAQVDMDKLLENLQEDKDLALRGLEAFLRTFPRTLPSGKQNTFAAHNEPDFIAVVVKDGAPRNLANAFLKPVRVSRHHPDDDLMKNSAENLTRYWKKLDGAYGQDGETFYLNLSEARPDFASRPVGSFEELVSEALKSVRDRLGE